MEIRDADVVGESGYNDMLEETCRLLEESGVAVRSDGALCVFFDDVKGPDGNPTPLIVKKSNGGYGYAATDLSAIRDRVQNLGATTLLYVVDARQSLHFKMVFETARRAGWLGDKVDAVQLAFGTVLGKDGKPFKTREGETVRLVDLLDEAIERATTVVREKNNEKIALTEEEIVANGVQIGIGAVKYADLSTSASRDYKFDLDQMVSLNGDTSVYLQYAYARIQSILRLSRRRPARGPPGARTRPGRAGAGPAPRPVRRGPGRGRRLLRAAQARRVPLPARLPLHDLLRPVPGPEGRGRPGPDRQPAVPVRPDGPHPAPGHGAARHPHPRAPLTATAGGFAPPAPGHTSPPPGRSRTGALCVNALASCAWPSARSPASGPRISPPGPPPASDGCPSLGRRLP